VKGVNIVLFWSLNTPTCEVTPRFAHNSQALQAPNMP
jgi:hypothetical protein